MKSNRMMKIIHLTRTIVSIIESNKENLVLVESHNLINLKIGDKIIQIHDQHLNHVRVIGIVKHAEKVILHSVKNVSVVRVNGNVLIVARVISPSEGNVLDARNLSLVVVMMAENPLEVAGVVAVVLEVVLEEAIEGVTVGDLTTEIHLVAIKALNQMENHKTRKFHSIKQK